MNTAIGKHCRIKRPQYPAPAWVNFFIIGSMLLFVSAHFLYPVVKRKWLRIAISCIDTGRRFGLWPIWKAMKAIWSGQRSFRASTLPVVASILLISILGCLYFLTIRLPTFIFPNADWSFIHDWLPNTTLYGMLSLLGFLTLVTLNTIARLFFRKR